MSEKHTLELQSGPVEYSSDPELAVEIFEAVTEAYLSNSLQVSEQENHPELSFIQLLRAKEKEYQDISLNGLFLATSLIFASKTKTIFSHLSEHSSFEKNYWVFIPSEVVEKDKDECYETLLNYIKPPGIVKRSIQEWQHNSYYLQDNYDGCIRNLFLSNENDARKILDVIIGGKERLKSKEGFRRFGTKLATLYLLWVNQYNMYELENIDDIGIPIDRHLRRFFIKTGILVAHNEIPVHNFSYDLMMPILKASIKELTEKGYRPWQVMNAIWGLSSHDCLKSLHDGCPIDNYCDRVSPREEKTKVIGRK